MAGILSTECTEKWQTVKSRKEEMERGAVWEDESLSGKSKYYSVEGKGEYHRV